MKRMVGKIQPYAWGSKDFIPGLLGTEPSGDPQAELWLGAHPLAPSLVGGVPLDHLVDADPAGVVGTHAVAAFGPRLPYLLKVLAAAQPLSLQAHPSRAQAEAGFAREQAAGVPRDAPKRVYRDDWPKPEALCALGEVHLLCGFRDPVQTFALFERLGAPSALALVEPLRMESPGALAEVFGQLLRRSDIGRDAVVQVTDAASRVDHDGALGEFARTARELSEFYPGDAGVLAALLMNRVRLSKDEAVFLPAGNLHSYLHGNGVEIMANSDNVLRGGLTSKRVDVDELLSVLDFTPGFAGLVQAVEEAPGVWAYQTSAPEFTLWRLEVRSDTRPGGPLRVPGYETGRVLLVTDGAVTVKVGTGELTLGRGQAAFVTAADENADVTGRGTVFVAGPGVG